jgi:outer membrane receptor protein involved in Fe transport
MNTTYYAACAQTGDATAITSADVTPWTAENKNNMWPKITSATSKEFLECSKWLQDGSFVRVKNLSIGYNLPREMLKFMDLKLTLSAQNLFTFTKYKGFDPEASTSTGDVNSGIDLGAYPSARTFTFGIQMTF